MTSLCGIKSIRSTCDSFFEIQWSDSCKSKTKIKPHQRLRNLYVRSIKIRGDTMYVSSLLDPQIYIKISTKNAITFESLGLIARRRFELFKTYVFMKNLKESFTPRYQMTSCHSIIRINPDINIEYFVNRYCTLSPDSPEHTKMDRRLIGILKRMNIISYNKDQHKYERTVL